MIFEALSDSCRSFVGIVQLDLTQTSSALTVCGTAVRYLNKRFLCPLHLLCAFSELSWTQGHHRWQGP